MQHAEKHCQIEEYTQTIGFSELECDSNLMASLSQSFDQFYDDDILRSEDPDRGWSKGGKGVKGVALAIEFFSLAYQKFKMANSYSRIHRLGRVLRFPFSSSFSLIIDVSPPFLFIFILFYFILFIYFFFFYFFFYF